MTISVAVASLPWPWVFAMVSAVAAGTASFLLLQQGVDLVWRLSRNSRLRTRIRPADVSLNQERRMEHLTHYLPLVLGVVGAALMAPKSPFLAGCFVAFGFILNRYLERKRSHARSGEVSQEMEKLMTVLHSAYLVRPVVAPALEEAVQCIHGPLREAVDHTLRAVWVGNDPKEAYATLGKAIPNPYLSQLGLVLERAEECDPILVGEALKELGNRLRRRRRLQSRVKASMSMLSGTVRFLQGANVVAVAVVLVTPTLSDFYMASLSRQGLFALALAAVLGASLYFDQQLSGLKERVL